MYSIRDLSAWIETNYPDVHPIAYSSFSPYMSKKGEMEDTKRFPSLHAAAGSTLLFGTEECPDDMMEELEAIATGRNESLWA